MSELTLELEENGDVSTRQGRLVSSGLAPTAEVPATRTKERPACYVPCPDCAQLVLRGKTALGLTLALDVSQTTYSVLWDTGATMPRLELSRGYPVHKCGGGAIDATAPAPSPACETGRAPTLDAGSVKVLRGMEPVPTPDA